TASGNFVMVNTLRGSDQPSIADFVLGIFLNHFLALFDEAFHAFAFLATRAGILTFEDSFQSVKVLLCLVEMHSKTIGKSVTCGSLRHLWQRLGQLLFGAVKAFNS